MSPRQASGHSKAAVRDDLHMARIFMGGCREELAPTGTALDALANGREALVWLNSALIRLEERVAAAGEDVPAWNTYVISLDGSDDQ